MTKNEAVRMVKSVVDEALRQAQDGNTAMIDRLRSGIPLTAFAADAMSGCPGLTEDDLREAYLKLVEYNVLQGGGPLGGGKGTWRGK